MVIYFTGTGNSRFAARRIAQALGDEAVDAAPWIRAGRGAAFTQGGPYVFVFPVYAAAPPTVFRTFIRRSGFPAGADAYFIAVSAGSMGASPAYCRKLARLKSLRCRGTAEIVMPQNYAILFPVRSPEKNRKTVEAALPHIDRAAAAVRAGRDLPAVRVSLWMRALTPPVLALYERFFFSARAFAATGRCVGCGSCASACPLGNITMRAGRPRWGGRCTHCMACICLCPREAIEYGTRTAGKPRYHGPQTG